MNKANEPPTRSRLRAELESWVKSRNLSPVEKNLSTVVTWVDLCSPESTTAENRFLASKELLVVFFSLDDFDDLDYEAYFDACEAILEGAEAPASEPVLQAYAEVIAEIEARGHDTSHYREGRRRLIEQYRWRNRARNEGVPTQSEYLRRRRITIYTQQWIDMWELLEGCILSPVTRASEELRGAVAQMVDWQLLQNDLVSLRRDTTRGEVNIVTLLRDRNGIGLEEAKQEIAEQRDQLQIELERSLTRLRDEAQTVPARYVDILDRCLQGTIENYRENLSRYDRDESLFRSTNR